ncbi:MAG: AMP-binding protein, partial [Burkholderiales bacterium]
IDDGKPATGLIDRTVANLREISPTIYFNVPRGFDMLIPYLENDAALRVNFFRRLRLIFYAGAALPQNLWERLEALSVSALGARVPIISAWGATETAPMATTVHFEIDRAGIIGLPGPACRALAALPACAPLSQVLQNPAVRERVREGLVKLAAESAGSSMHATRALLLEEPPKIDANEITDKGYINQRAVLERRAAQVERLYANRPNPEIIGLESG